MNTEALDYIKTQKIGILAVEMLDGSPHAAAVHFTHTESPLEFLIKTGSDTRKVEALIQNGKTRASFVIGAEESNMKTLQMNGIARVGEKNEDPKALTIIFTPTWWRYTDYKTPEGKKIWSSE